MAVNVQFGSGTFGAGVSTSNIPISSIDVNKSFGMATFRTTAGLFDVPSYLTTGHLTSSTNLAARRNDTVNSSGNFRWFVYTDDSITVERGSTSMSLTTVDITITSVVLANAFPIIQARTANSPAAGKIGNAFVQAEIINTTTLRLTIPVADAGLTVDWKIISSSKFTVSKYTPTATGTTFNHAITAVADLNKTFVVGTQGGINVNEPFNFKVYGLTSTTNVRYRSQSSTSSVFITYVVEMQNGITDHIEITNDVTNSITSATALTDQTKSFSLCGGLYHNMGSINSFSEDAFEYCFRSNINSTPEVRSQRGGTAAIHFNQQSIQGASGGKVFITG